MEGERDMVLARWGGLLYLVDGNLKGGSKDYKTQDQNEEGSVAGVGEGDFDLLSLSLFVPFPFSLCCVLYLNAFKRTTKIFFPLGGFAFPSANAFSLLITPLVLI